MKAKLCIKPDDVLCSACARQSINSFDSSRSNYSSAMEEVKKKIGILLLCMYHPSAINTHPESREAAQDVPRYDSHALAATRRPPNS